MQTDGPIEIAGSRRGEAAPADLAEQPGKGLSPARWILFLAACLLYGTLCVRHVWQHDEAHSLLLIRANHSLSELWLAIRYEGSPGMYHFLLWGVGHLVPLNVPVLITIHVVTLVLLLGVICFRLPMPTLAAALLLLQPCFLWHAYNIRQYALGVLLILLWVCRFRWDAPRLTLRNTLLLALATQFSAHLALCAGLLHLVAWACTGIRLRREELACHAVMLGACALTVVQMVPPPDMMEGLRSWESQTWYFHELVAALVWNAILGDYLLSSLLVGGIAAGVARVWRRDREAAWVVLLAIALMFWICIVIAHFKYSTVYHFGIITVFLLSIALVLCRGIEIPRPLARVAPVIWLTAIGITVAGSAVPQIQRLFGDSTYTREVARYLDTNFPDRPLLAHKEFLAAPVRVYLRGIPRVYSLGRKQWIEASRWNDPSVDWRKTPWYSEITMQELLALLRDVPPALLAQRPVLLAAAYDVDFDTREDPPGSGYPMGAFRLMRRASFTKGELEKYHVFEVVPARLEPVPPATGS